MIVGVVMNIKLKTAVHKKTGNIYHVLDVKAIDCTNVRDGVKVVIYYRDGMFFVREKKEFDEKFEMHN